MKILGIDYGAKRLGVAISDETQTLARELAIVPAAEFFATIKQLIQDNEIKEIVVGLPLNMNGQDSDKTREARGFAVLLERETGLPVALSDERLSSQMASALPGGKENIDSLAAQIILQNYLDKKARR